MPNVLTGYTGISFPFRIGVRGGVVMSGTDRHGVPHIEESILQVLGTRPMERWMEYHIFSDLDVFMYEPNDRSLQTLLRHQLVRAMRHDRRVKIRDVNFDADENYLWVDIDFSVESYLTAKPLRVAFDRRTGMLAGDFFPMRDSG